MTATHQFGDLVILQATFTGADKVPADPEAVFASYVKPDGTEINLTFPEDNLIRISDGIYNLQINVDLDITGQWNWRIFSDTTLQAAIEGYFNVNQTFTIPVEDTITAEDIVNQAKSPKEVTTDEGTVKERSVNELIAADQHSANKAAIDGPLHGLRVSRAIPGGAV